MSWQPIETAPKDGTTILIAAATRTLACHQGSYEVAAARWLPDRDGGKAYPWWVVDEAVPEGENGWVEQAPTHWMPLPEAPTPGAQS